MRCCGGSEASGTEGRQSDRSTRTRSRLKAVTPFHSVLTCLAPTLLLESSTKGSRVVWQRHRDAEAEQRASSGRLQKGMSRRQLTHLDDLPDVHVRKSLERL